MSADPHDPEGWGPEKWGVVQASAHPLIAVGSRVRVPSFRRLQAGREHDLYRVEVGGAWFKAYAAQVAPGEARLVLDVAGSWPRHWDDGPDIERWREIASLIDEGGRPSHIARHVWTRVHERGPHRKHIRILEFYRRLRVGLPMSLGEARRLEAWSCLGGTTWTDGGERASRLRPRHAPPA